MELPEQCLLTSVTVERLRLLLPDDLFYRPGHVR